MFELIYPSEPAQLLPKPTAENPSSNGRTNAEMLPVVDASGIVTGQAARSYLHGGSMLLHPVVHLHIINRNGELYLQKRSMLKDLLPGRWDTAVGGHVDYGESLSEALYREASEELGFYDFNPIYIKTYEFESKVEKELVNIFATVGNFDLKPDNYEVDEGRWWKMDEIEAAIGKDILTPQFESEFPPIRKTLEALL